MTLDSTSPLRRLLSRRVAGALIAGAGLVAAATFTGHLPAKAAGDGLTLLEWSGYEDAEIHKAYIAKHGGSPDYSFFADEQEAFQKVRAGFKADLYHPCSQGFYRFEDAGLFKPIDTSRIPNWGKLIARFKELPGVQRDGKTYVVPADWGNTGLVYRTDEVSEDEGSTLAIFDNPKFKGKVSIADNAHDAFALAYLVNGIKDWTQVTDEQFKAAATWLRKIHPNVRTYWSDYSALIQSMAQKEILVAWAWNDTPTKLAEANIPAKMRKDTKEGVSTWVCGFSLLSTGEGSEDKAYDYINAWLEAESAKYLVTAWGYGHSNSDVFKTVEPAVLAEKGFADIETFLANSLFQVPPPTTLDEKMINEWEKIKAGY